MSQLESPERTDASPARLTPRAIKWLASFDEKLRPKVLPERYIRITNRLADLWGQPDLTRKYFDELLVDLRGNRAGFPDDILVEIGSLKHYYEKELFPMAQDVWSKIWANMN